MQILRFAMLLALLVTLGAYTYIYLRGGVGQLGGWSLTLTTLTFGFLFIGSGWQKVYQRLVDLGKIDYGNKKKKTNLWRTGVFFYSVSLPMSAMASFFYWVDLGQLFKKLSTAAFRQRHPWLEIQNQSIRADIGDKIQYQYERRLHNNRDPISHSWLDSHGKTDDTMTWRERVVMAAHVLPALCLLVDMSINKIKIKLGHFWFALATMLGYLVTTVFTQYIYVTPHYIHNLNWFCNANMSYLYEKESRRIQQTLRVYECKKPWEDQSTVSCGNYFKGQAVGYYCPAALLNDAKYFVESDFKGAGYYVYSRWKNCWLFVTVFLVGGVLFWFLMYYCHRCKLGSTMAFVPKTQRVQIRRKVAEVNKFTGKYTDVQNKAIQERLIANPAANVQRQGENDH